ncbi:unnamed protein product, partial [marine sediment metagenome]
TETMDHRFSWNGAESEAERAESRAERLADQLRRLGFDPEV